MEWWMRDFLVTSNGELFELAVVKGYDLEDFAMKLFNSELSFELYDSSRPYRWDIHTTVMEEIEENLEFKFARYKYRSEASDLGEFYRYLMITRDMKPSQVLNYISLDALDKFESDIQMQGDHECIIEAIEYYRNNDMEELTY